MEKAEKATLATVLTNIQFRPGIVLLRQHVVRAYLPDGRVQDSNIAPEFVQSSNAFGRSVMPAGTAFEYRERTITMAVSPWQRSDEVTAPAAGPRELTAEETYLAVEKWLKARRDDSPDDSPDAAWAVIDQLLDEWREAGAVGRLPDPDREDDE